MPLRRSPPRLRSRKAAPDYRVNFDQILATVTGINRVYLMQIRSRIRPCMPEYRVRLDQITGFNLTRMYINTINL